MVEHTEIKTSKKKLRKEKQMHNSRANRENERGVHQTEGSDTYRVVNSAAPSYLTNLIQVYAHSLCTTASIKKLLKTELFCLKQQKLLNRPKVFCFPDQSCVLAFFLTCKSL